MIYLDNSATTILKPPGVMEAISAFSGNPGRGGHGVSVKSARVIYECREKLCTFFGASSPEQIIFVKNGTEALNLVILGLLNKTDHVVLTSMEHNSVVRPVVESGVLYTIVKADEKGFVNLSEIEKAFQENTKLLIVTHASNVCGSLQDISALTKLAHQNGIPVLVDAAQTAGIIPVNLIDVKIDFLAFSGHKGMMGPLGTGVLILNSNCTLTPLMYGGTGSVSEASKQPEFLPDRFESGTLNGCGVAGLLKATEFLTNVGVETVEEKKNLLVQRLIDGLLNIPKVIFYGSADAKRRADAISFNITGMECNQLAAKLEEGYGILGRSGFQCSPLAHKTIGSFALGGTVRLSPSFFTTTDEIDIALNAIQKISKE